ncbi:MAG: alanine/glycine:cation symporter family protein [Bariatricus sp.]
MELLFQIQALVWGPGLLFLFLGTGTACTLHLKGFPLLGVRRWWKSTAGVLGCGGKKEKQQVATACTALAATVGTGNIAGVATALAAGGPGAVFWMWVSAVLGMATAYAEVSLGIRYRQGAGSGPYYYLDRGLGWRQASFLYAFFCALASLGMGSMVQSNSIADSLSYAFSVPPFLCGLAVTLLTAVVILGGIRRISQAAGILVPISAGLYLFFGGIVVLSCYERLPAVLAEILLQAFGLRSLAGGAAGYTMAQAVRFGVARGVFSNEAGLGSLAVLHGSSERSASPEEQGMWAIFEVFFDTMVSCTLTALVLLCVGESGSGSAAVASAFAGCFGRFGGWITAMSMALFAFASIIAWFYLGKQAVSYLAVSVPLFQMLERWYPGIYLIAVFLGAVSRLTAVWTLSDIFNGLMAVPNLLGVLFLLREVKRPEQE